MESPWEPSWTFESYEMAARQCNANPDFSRGLFPDERKSRPIAACLIALTQRRTWTGRFWRLALLQTGRPPDAKSAM